MENPELYVTSNALQKRDAAAVLAKYVPQMTWGDNDRVLDIGCGSGDITCHLLAPYIHKCDRIVGVDISKEMVAFAEKNHSLHDDRLRFVQVDIARIIQPRQIFPQGFHKIFSFYCLHWIRDHRRLLENLYNLTESNGEILLVFLASNPIFTVYERMSEKTEWVEYMKDINEFISPYQHSVSPAQEFETLCENVGFDILDCEAPCQTYAYDNINHVKSAITAVNPFVKRIPSTLRDKYILESLQELQRVKTPSNDGKMVATYRLIVAHLQKPEY